jgi:hypothetical protein
MATIDVDINPTEKALNRKENVYTAPFSVHLQDEPKPGKDNQAKGKLHMNGQQRFGVDTLTETDHEKLLLHTYSCNRIQQHT